jgi:hypothetical protein
MIKSSAKVEARKTRHSRRKTAAKNARKVRKKVAAELVRDTQRKIGAPFEQFRTTQVQDTFRDLAERNVAQTRALYEHSKNTLQAVLASWQNSFGAIGKGAVELNRRIIGIADRNINNGFDLADAIATAKNPAEIVELNVAYWRRQMGYLSATTKVRALPPRMVAKETRRKVR